MKHRDYIHSLCSLLQAKEPKFLQPLLMPHAPAPGTSLAAFLWMLFSLQISLPQLGAQTGHSIPDVAPQMQSRGE